VTTVEEYPAYLETLEVHEERTVRKRIEDLETEISSLKKSLEDSQRSRRILLMGDTDLEKETSYFLSEFLGLKAQAPEEGGEDFSLVDGDAKRWCIGKVRTIAAGNVTKEHVARLMIARMQAEMAETAPALFVANTFQAGKTLSERDQPVPADVAKRAAEDHVVVVRVMDLVRLFQRAASGMPTGEQLAEALRAGGGWFEVDEALNVKIHGAEEASPNGAAASAPAPPAPAA
jgi:hypothetical protein